MCDDVAQSLAHTITALSRHVIQQTEGLDPTISGSRSRSRGRSRGSPAAAAALLPDPGTHQAGSSLHPDLDPLPVEACGTISMEHDSAADESAEAGRTTLSAVMLDPWFADVLQRSAVRVKQDGATPLASHLMHCTRERGFPFQPSHARPHFAKPKGLCCGTCIFTCAYVIVWA